MNSKRRLLAMLRFLGGSPNDKPAALSEHIHRAFAVLRYPSLLGVQKSFAFVTRLRGGMEFSLGYLLPQASRFDRQRLFCSCNWTEENVLEVS